jgi:hypothetical protein
MIGVRYAALWREPICGIRAATFTLLYTFLRRIKKTFAHVRENGDRRRE